MNLGQLWTAGDWPMYPITLLGLIGFPLAMASVALAVQRTGARKATMLATVALAFGIWPVGCGVLGYQSGIKRVEQALLQVNIRDRESILAVGENEANIDWKYGLLAGAIPLIGGTVALGVGLSRLRREQAHG
jgi:hypothetical protein